MSLKIYQILLFDYYFKALATIFKIKFILIVTLK